MTSAYILFGETGFCTSQMCFGIVWEDFFFFFSGGGRKKVPYRTGLSIARVCESHRYNLLYICVRGACSSYGACVWGWFERHFFFFSGRGARVVLVSVWGARVGLGSAPVLVRGSGGSGSQSSQGGSRLSLRRPQSVLVSVWVLIVLALVWGGPLVSLGLVRVGVLIKDTLRTSQNRRWFFARAPELNQTT